MNDTEKTEDLLRKAPRLRVPPGLLEKLQAGIALPGAAAQHSPKPNSRPLLRKWLPVLSFSAMFLACVVAVAVQSNLLSELRRQNQSLRASTQNLERLRQDNVEYQKLRAENQQLVQLRKDNLELETLRNEVDQLRGQMQELSSLQAEHQRLLAEKKAAESRHPSDAGQEVDPFGIENAKAQRIACVNNMKQIVLAARIWADDTDRKIVLPSDFISMSNELNSPKLLICPADTNRLAAVRWSEFAPENVSYELVSPGASGKDPAVVYVRCVIHNNVGLVDGSVQQLDPKRKLIQKDGKWVIEKPSPKPDAFE